jgi:hypothetical protein
MRGLSSSNCRVTRLQTTNKCHSEEDQGEEQGESRPSVPTMASQPPDPHPITLITRTLPVVKDRCDAARLEVNMIISFFS